MAAKTELKRRAILAATLDEFEANGYAGARMEDIARRAGVAKGTIYTYFPGKQALLMGLAEEIGSTLHATLRQLTMDTQTPLMEKLERLFGQVLQENGQGRSARILRVVWSEGMHRPEVTRPIFQKFLLPLFAPRGLLDQLLCGENVPEVVRLYPIALVAPIMQGVMWQGLMGQDAPLDLRDYFHRYLELVSTAGEAEKKAAAQKVRSQMNAKSPLVNRLQSLSESVKVPAGSSSGK